jgi:hypothetical protein
MKHRRISFKFLGIAGVVLLNMASCHSSPSAPNPPSVPSTPAGYINCVGHAHHYVDVAAWDSTTWYAFWYEVPDSSSATLIVGINPSEIDSFYLSRDTSSFTGWIDTNSSTNSFGAVRFSTTSDSVILDQFGIDAGTIFYLKKLN